VGTGGPLARFVRALVLATAAVLLLGLVVVAAGGYRLGDSGSDEASPYAIDTMVTVILAVYAIGALALIGVTIWAGVEMRRSPLPAPVRRRRTFPALALTLSLFAVLLLMSERFHWRFDLSRLRRPPAATTTAPTTPSGVGNTPQASNRRPHEPRFQIVPFLVVLGAAGAAFAALYAAEKRRKQRLPREAPIADELAEALDETLEDLREESDPRRAVIAAYARMERVLAGHGIPRSRFEAPHEYLARVLSDLTHGGRGAERLTALFERARFSTHAIEPAMKDEAIAAVEQLQAELAAADAARAA
jgi:Domain of unknown function (DUF4129)